MLWKVFSVCLVLFAIFLVLMGNSDEVMEKSLDLLSTTTGGQQKSMTNGLLTMVAAVMVFGFYVYRFGLWRVGQKTPRGFPLHPPRAFTTWVQYTSWAVLYGLAVVTAFLVIVYLPEFSSKVLMLLSLFLPANLGLDRLSVDAENLAARGRDHVYFLMTGLTILLLFAGTQAEGALRTFFHRRAMIPREAESLFSQLKIDFHRKPIQDEESVRKFLEHSRHDPDMPTYHAFELQLDVQAALENRLELLPRTEFILWRLKQRGFSAAIDKKLDNHAPDIEELMRDVAKLRTVASRCNRQLVGALDGYFAVVASGAADIALREAAGGAADEMARFRQIAGVEPENDRITEIPISRLDNVASELQASVTRLRQTLKQANVVRGPTAAGQPNAPQPLIEAEARIDRLQMQLDELVNGLTPLCSFGLETIDALLKDNHPLLRDVCDRTLAFAICAALSASTRPNQDFFLDLGLDPQRQFVRFHAGRAAIMVTSTLFAYLAVIVVIGSMEPTPAFFKMDKWLVLGGWFIVGSILYGCYHGSAIASMRAERGRPSDQGDFDLTDYLFAYGVIWSVLIIGLFIIAVSYSDSGLFASSAPFAFVAAVWGAMTAAASARTLLSVPAIKLVRDVPLSLIFVTLIVGLIWTWKKNLGAGDQSDIEWQIIFALALGLTLSLNVAIRWSIDSGSTSDSSTSEVA